MSFWLAALIAGAVLILAAAAFAAVDETIAALESKTDLLAPIKDTAMGLGSLGVAVTAIMRSESEPGG
jgi:hypothetical protein